MDSLEESWIVKQNTWVVHLQASLFIVVHCYSLLFIVVHCCLLLFIVVHCCSLLFIVVHCCSLLFIIVHCYSLLFTTSDMSRHLCHLASVKAEAQYSGKNLGWIFCAKLPDVTTFQGNMNLSEI